MSNKSNDNEYKPTEWDKKYNWMYMPAWRKALNVWLSVEEDLSIIYPVIAAFLIICAFGVGNILSIPLILSAIWLIGRANKYC